MSQICPGCNYPIVYGGYCECNKPPTIGWSDFAKKRHTPSSGNSYTTLTDDEIVRLILNAWDKRTPGQGETGIDRKVVVPIEFKPGDFFLPMVALDERLPVYAQVVKRQEGEKPFIETYCWINDVVALGLKLIEPQYVNIVCYTAEALLENDGTRSTDCDWEIVAVLASEYATEPMTPLTMARNFLEEAGGTKSVYTADQFASAIWHHATKRGVKVKNIPNDPEGVKALVKADKERVDRCFARHYHLQKHCKHEFRPMTLKEATDKWSYADATCLHCKTDFGKLCNISPDRTCHSRPITKDGVVIGVKLIDGKEWIAAEHKDVPFHPDVADDDNWDGGLCLFCQMPLEPGK